MTEWEKPLTRTRESPQLSDLHPLSDKPIVSLLPAAEEPPPPPLPALSALPDELERELAECRRAEDDLLDTVARLRRSQLELRLSQAETIRRLAFAAEFRNAETGRHTERMSRYCELLARKLELDEERCELIRLASELHDVGKIAIPDRILLKPGRLTDSERRVL